MPDTGLRALLTDQLPITRTEDAEIPLVIVAADALSGEEVLLATGDAVDAITAGASLPAIFPAAKMRVDGRERLLVDGAIINNTAITTALHLARRRPTPRARRASRPNGDLSAARERSTCTKKSPQSDREPTRRRGRGCSRSGGVIRRRCCAPDQSMSA